MPSRDRSTGSGGSQKQSGRPRLSPRASFAAHVPPCPQGTTAACRNPGNAGPPHPIADRWSSLAQGYQQKAASRPDAILTNRVLMWRDRLSRGMVRCPSRLDVGGGHLVFHPGWSRPGERVVSDARSRLIYAGWLCRLGSTIRTAGTTTSVAPVTRGSSCAAPCPATRPRCAAPERFPSTRPSHGARSSMPSWFLPRTEGSVHGLGTVLRPVGNDPRT